MLKIVHGNPLHAPASYTRFILPFAYSPNSPETHEPENNCHYEFVEPDDLDWRKRYLTHETADVLFRRAKWAKLKNGAVKEEEEMLFRDGNRLKVNVSSPALILFEWQVCDDKKCDNLPETKILRTGFLVVEAHFPSSNDSPPTLDNLLELNEIL